MDFVPIDFAGVEAERNPSARGDVGREIESLGLSLSQPLVIARQDFAGNGDDTIAVMVVEEVGESLFLHQELGMRAVDDSYCLGQGEGEFGDAGEARVFALAFHSEP